MDAHIPDIAQPEPLRHLLAILQAPGIGPATLRRLLEHLETPSQILAASSRHLRQLGLTDAAVAALRRPDWRAVDRNLEWAALRDRHLVHLEDPTYPPLLREIADPPILLFAEGDARALATNQVAVVGSRNATPGGRHMAERLAADLAATGIAVTSGLARGIDAAAHRGALTTGRTVAVMGTGPDAIYPRSHSRLAQQIIHGGGALLSEFPVGTPPRRDHFPRRNRLIAGLSLGTVVVEAARQSGSLITARLAAEQNREVFAVPGAVSNPLSRGCHSLIREGAKLVESADDIIEEIGLLVPAPRQGANTTDKAAQESGVSGELAQIYRHLGYEHTPVDMLVDRTGLTAEEVSSMLVALELQGLVVAMPGGLYSRKT